MGVEIFFTVLLVYILSYLFHRCGREVCNVAAVEYCTFSPLSLYFRVKTITVLNRPHPSVSDVLKS